MASHPVPHCAGEVLERALREQPTREALVAIDRRFTYEQLDEEIERVAAAIGALGIGAGDVVAVSLPNASDVVVTFHTLMRLGAVWLGVNGNLAPPEKRYVLDDAGARLMLADAEVAGALARSPVPTDPPVLVVCGPGEVEWRERLWGNPGSYRRIRRDPMDLAALAYTSGTTGRPKGVLHSHRNILLPGAVLVAARRFGPELRKGDCAAMTILNMQVTSTLLVAQAGGTQIVMDRSDPPGVAQWIRSEKVNAWFGVPTLLQGLARSDEVAAEDLASLSDVWTGGTFLASPTRAEFESGSADDCTPRSGRPRSRPSPRSKSGTSRRTRDRAGEPSPTLSSTYVTTTGTCFRRVRWGRSPSGQPIPVRGPGSTVPCSGTWATKKRRRVHSATVRSSRGTSASSTTLVGSS